MQLLHYYQMNLANGLLEQPKIAHSLRQRRNLSVAQKATTSIPAPAGQPSKITCISGLLLRSKTSTKLLAATDRLGRWPKVPAKAAIPFSSNRYLQIHGLAKHYFACCHIYKC